MVGPLPPPPGGIASFVEFQLASPELAAFELVLLDNRQPPGGGRGLPRRLVRSAGLIWRCLWLLLRERPSVAHLHSSSYRSFFEKALLMRLCRGLGTRTILHIHGGSFERFYRESRHQRLIRRTLDRADRVLVVAESWRGFFESLTATPVRVLPNCAGESFFRAESDPGRGRKLVFVGELARAKGVFELLKAVRDLRREGFDHPLLLACGSRERAELEEFERLSAGMEGIELRFGLTPEELRRELEQAALFVLPSHFEGLPIALLEAMAVGLPLVATPVGGIPELVAEGGNGLLAPVGESAPLADHLRRLLSDPELRRRMGTRSRELARARYHPAAVGAQLAGIYRELLEGC